MFNRAIAKVNTLCYLLIISRGETDMTKSVYYVEPNKTGRLCVRSHRDPSWFCDVGLFLSDKYGAHSDCAKQAVRAAVAAKA